MFEKPEFLKSDVYFKSLFSNTNFILKIFKRQYQTYKKYYKKKINKLYIKY